MDQRILNRSILNGEITEENLQAALASLPDLSDHAKEITIPWETTAGVIETVVDDETAGSGDDD